MPSYVKLYQLGLIWPIFLAAILIAAITFFSYMFFNKRSLTFSAPKSLVGIVSITFSLLGIVVGFLSAGSRESILGQVIPASLSLIGLLSAYLFTKQSEALPYVIASAFTLTSGILLGTVWGAEYRVQSSSSREIIDLRAATLKYCLEEQEKLRERFRIRFNKEPELASANLKCEEAFRE